MLGLPEVCQSGGASHFRKSVVEAGHSPVEHKIVRRVDHVCSTVPPTLHMPIDMSIENLQKYRGFVYTTCCMRLGVHTHIRLLIYRVTRACLYACTV